MADAWYPRYPGDYARRTAHLSLVEHGALTVLLDYYYSTGRALPADRGALYRLCRAFRAAERRAVDRVVEQFFSPGEDRCLHNKRADEELQKREEFHAKLSAAGRKRWEKPGSMPGSSQAGSQAGSQAIASPQSSSHPQSTGQRSKSSPQAPREAGDEAGPRRPADDSIPALLKRLQNQFPDLSDTRFRWAVDQVRKRAKTPPRSAAFFQRAIPTVLENLPAEVGGFLARRAEEMLGNNHAVGDIAGELKQLAAANDVPYGADLIVDAIEAAEACLRRRRAVESEMRAGNGPEVRQ